jgi:hypothetical protein
MRRIQGESTSANNYLRWYLDFQAKFEKKYDITEEKKKKIRLKIETIRRIKITSRDFYGLEQD